MATRLTIPLFTTLLVVSVGVTRTYADPCSTCDGAPGFPEATAFLDSHGYPASEYAVLISWQETTPAAPATFVTGYHVRPRSGGDPFDLYSDATGNLLTKRQWTRLGIQPKNWDLPPMEQGPELGILPPKMALAAPRPVGVAKSIVPSGGILLPEIDLAGVIQEDQTRLVEQGKGPTRIGVFQDLHEPVTVDGRAVSHGFWQTVPGGGTLWSVAIYSPGALGLRIHFSQINLPPGASVVVYNPTTPSEAYGPYTGPAPGMTDLWSATCFSDTAVVECFVPSGVDPALVHLAIDRVVHNYVPFGELSWAKAAGSCNVDVTCYPEWASAATAVGGVGSIGGNGSFFCSGSLLADTDSATDIPYFLTANHCVGSSDQAGSLEFYWLYQTSTCNGTPPNPATVPRTTGGAQLLATTTASSGTDFCLLRLNNLPPAGLSKLGWSSAATPLATTTACIHHPSVDYKRITFGVVTDVPESNRTLRPADRYYQSSWTLGTTEPGSSGSPLMIQATQQVIGQLWGGPGSCTTSTNLDYFGRFDVGFPLMVAYLDPQITPTITVIRPNAAKNWPLGRRRRIRWTWTGNFPGRIRIELWRNGSFVQIIQRHTRNDGKARWHIDPTLPPGGGYIVRVKSKLNSSIFDDSDVPFSLHTP